MHRVILMYGKFLEEFLFFNSTIYSLKKLSKLSVIYYI